MQMLLKNLALLLIPLALINCSTATAPQASPEAETRASPSPVPILHLDGDADELGSQHAQQLGPEIKSLYRSYFDSYFQSSVNRKIALLLASGFEPHISPEHRREIAALAAALQMDEREVMLGQCFLDATAMTACTTFTLPASASPDGVARFGRNLDFPGFDVADKSSVLLVFHPSDRYAFASIAWPGMLGVLSGMNEHGLTVANMEVDRPMRPPTAMPYTLLYRTILDRCRTVDEAVAYLKRTGRQTPNNLMLMDAAGNRAVAEITPQKVTVRTAPSGQMLISTNHQRGTDLDQPGRCWRFDYLHDSGAQSFGRIDLPAVKRMLLDAAQGQMTLQSMVFEPANRRLHLAVGKRAPARPFGTVDLGALFDARSN